MVGGDAWLNTLIASRVARLPGAQADLVRAAAVIGNVIPSWLLESVTGCGEHDPLVRGLAEQDFIFPGEKAGTLRFKHGITRDVIYDAVGLHQRRAMHLRIAESLRQQGSSGVQEEFYEELAYHYAAGGQAADAALYAELAGDKAIAASALDRAQTQYSPRWLRSICWSHRAATTGAGSRYRSAGFGLCVRSVEGTTRGPAPWCHACQPTTTRPRAGAEYWLGYVNYALGESRVAIHHCERALEVARRVGDDPLIVQIRATLGQAEAAACDYDRSLELLDEAIAVKRLHRVSARPAVGLSYTLTCKASVLGDRGLFAQAHACFEEALDAVRNADHGVKGSLLCWRSAVYLWQGKWEDARQSASEAQRVAERVKSLYLFAMSRALWAYGSWMIKPTPESLQTIIDATSWIEARGRSNTSR